MCVLFKKKSIPLSEIECPQFSWVVRNNSANISAILQPEEYAAGKAKNFNHEYLCPNQGMECNCIDKTLKPTLFPHPANCVCYNDACPPRDNLYRHYKLKLENQALGDIMEEILKERLPSSSPSPICKGGKLLKKTMISSHTPEQLCLDDGNPCTECYMKESSYQGILHRNLNVGNVQPRCKICVDTSKCVETCKDYDQSYVNSFLERSRHTDTIPIQNSLCKCENDTCKREQVDRYVECKTCGCNFGKGSTLEANDTTRGITESTNKSTDLLSHSKTAELTQNDEMKSPKKSKKSSSVRSPKQGTTNWKRPDKITNGRFDTLEEASSSEGGIEVKKDKKVAPDVYEHFRNSNAVASGSTSSKYTNSFRSKKSGDAINSKDYTISKKTTRGNAKKAKHRQHQLHKYPWNFNNQPKPEDPMKTWKGTRDSARKSTKNPKSKANVEIGSNNFMRSRAGDDLGNFTQNNEPKYFEYKPNLMYPEEHSTESEENINLKEQRKYNKGLGKMRVNNWHQKMDEYAEKLQESAEPETIRNGVNKKQKNYKEKDIFSDDDNDNGKENKLSETIKCVAKACNDKTDAEKTNNEAALSERFYHAEKNAIHREKPAKNMKLNSLFSKNPLDMKSSIKHENRGDCSGISDKRKHMENDFSHLSTIFEECPGICDCNHEKESRNSNLTHCSSSVGNKLSSSESKALQNRPKSAGDFRLSDQRTQENTRPKSTVSFKEESFKKPYFSVIRQKIHSRTENNLEELGKFRNEHFFETHDTERYLPHIPEHTCVHRFTVDDRLYPQPLHSNVFGTSCCIHCDKPMKNEKTVFSDQRESVDKVRGIQKVQKHLSKFSLRPKPVHIGSKNSVMEIQLGPEHVDLLKPEKIIELKRTHYTNSLALRHQRR